MYSIVPTYLWQHPSWLHTPDLPECLFKQAERNFQLEGELKELVHVEDMERRMVEALAQEVVDNFAIEGITLDSYAVRSSIVRECSLDIPEWDVKRVILLEREQRAVEATLQALRHAGEEMSVGFLCGINRLLSPSRGIGEADDVPYGEIRVTGTRVREEGSGRVVFRGPEPGDVPQLVEQLCAWWNETKGTLPPIIRGAVGHLFLVMIHPFNDGNGRIARILAEMAPASLNPKESFRLYSISNSIFRNKSQYYRLLEKVTGPSHIHMFVKGILDFQTEAIRYSMKYFTKKNILKCFWESSSHIFSPFQKRLIESIALDMSGKEWDMPRIERMFPNMGYKELHREWQGILETNIVEKGHFIFDGEDESICLKP